jgi:hypothetical protein
MAYSTARLEKYLKYVDGFLDVDRVGIKEAPNGDHYLTFKVTTTNARQEHLESDILTHINNAVDPDAYGIYTGPKGGKHTSTYTVILDESDHDIDLISGRYGSYHNDLAGISINDARYATRPGYPTPYLIDGVPFKVNAPHATVLGQSIAEWTEDWWMWALQAPLATNPLLDQTGADANVENGEAVHFIAGTFEGTVGRTFEVPGGKPLLIPMVNFIANKFDVDAPSEVDQQKVEIDKTLEADIASVDVNSLFAEIDGVRINNLSSHLEETDFFSPGQAQPGSLLEFLSENNVDETGNPNPALPGDDQFPTKSAGYWLMIEHLAPGPHTLHFGGSFEDGEATVKVDVTDYIYIT